MAVGAARRGRKARTITLRAMGELREAADGPREMTVRLCDCGEMAGPAIDDNQEIAGKSRQ